MEKETSISKNIIRDFNKKAEEIRSDYSLNLQLVEIFGSRWSYVAGYIDKSEVNLPPAKLKLTDKMGILVYGDIRDPLIMAKIERELLGLAR